MLKIYFHTLISVVRYFSLDVEYALKGDCSPLLSSVFCKPWLLWISIQTLLKTYSSHSHILKLKAIIWIWISYPVKVLLQNKATSFSVMIHNLQCHHKETLSNILSLWFIKKDILMPVCLSPPSNTVSVEKLSLKVWLCKC